MKKYIFTLLSGLVFAATLTASDPPKPVIIGIEHAMSERMLSPQGKKTVLSFFQRERGLAAVESIDIGDGFFLISHEQDLTGALLEIRVNDELWSELTSVNAFIPRLKEITNRVYGKVNDDFDFIFFVLNAPMDDNIKSNLGFYGLNSRVSNNVQGLGVGKHDNTAEWGSQGKLISSMYFPNFDAISTGPSLHEMLHSWGAFICPTYDLGNRQYLAHWGISNANGQAGGFKYLRVVEENAGGVEGKTLYQASRSPETNRDGSFKNGGFGINANDGNGSPYSDIELYLMGLKSDDELRNANFQLDVFSGNEYEADAFAQGYFYSTAKRSYTIDDLIARNGKRDPDASISQKEFKLLTIVITAETAQADFKNEIMRDVNWFAGDVNDATYPNLYNFRQATENRGSLIVNNLTASLKTPIIREIEIPSFEETEVAPAVENFFIAESGDENDDNEELPDVTIYPNPTDGLFTMEYESMSEGYTITITDARGIVVLRRAAADSLIQLDLTNFPSGMYLLTIEDGMQRITKRVIRN